MTSFPAGLLLGFSLIVAIGAQNVFVLRQGLRREHVALVAAICAVSDAVLIVLGVSGIGAATTALPWLVDAVRWAGAAFLVGYGVLAARRALRPDAVGLDAAAPDAAAPDAAAPDAAAPDALRPVAVSDALRRGPGASLPATTGPGVPVPAASDSAPTAVVGTATLTRTSPRIQVALTALALTWLNPHVYLDTVFLLGSVSATHGDARWLFAAGATVASAIWFFGLAYGARYLSRWLATPRAWRILDAGIAVVMLALAASLVLGPR